MPSTAVLTESPHRAVAPAWHTAVVLFVLLGLALEGARSGSLPFSGAHGRAAGYVLVMMFEWVTVAFIWYAVSRRAIRIPDLVGGSWPRPGAFLRDLGIGIGFLIICGVGVVNGLGYLLKVAPNQQSAICFLRAASKLFFG